ncbi:MAG: EamA family transporter [Nitriliruptoraceae bacterium]
MGSLLSLLAAVGFGVSDVTGAVAARRVSALTVTFGMQVVGLFVLLPALAFLPGEPSAPAFALGALGGGTGTLGLVLYLRAMAVGPMGVISPIAALVGAAVPVTWGLLLAGDRLAPRQLVGIALGLAAVVAVAYVPGVSVKESGVRGPLAALLAGGGFGLFFVALDATPAGSGLWPLLGARTAAIVISASVAVVRGRDLVPRRVAGLVTISGLTDMAANVLFLEATRVGLLSLVSLLTSLFPVVALLTARWWLHERLTSLQAIGVLAALVATGLLVV